MQTDENSSEYFIHRTRTAISTGESSQSKLKRFFQSLLISHVSRWKSVFDFLVIVSINISTLLLLYKYVFYPDYYYFIDNINPYIEFLFFIYIILNFFQKYQDKRTGEIICSYRKICLRYLTGWFIIDFLSIFPFNLFLSRYTFFVYYKLIRIIRMPKLIQMISCRKLRHIAKSFYLSNTKKKYYNYYKVTQTIKLFWLIGISLLVTYLIACLWFWVCKESEKNSPQSFIRQYEIDNDSPLGKLIKSFYFVLTILTTAGFGHFTAISIEEKIVSIGVMLFGAFAFSLFITAMSGKGDEKEEQDSQLQRCYAEINSKINGKLIKKIDRQVSYFTEKDVNFFVDSKNFIIHSLPFSLKKKLFNFYWKEFYEQFFTIFSFYGNNVQKYFDFYFEVSFYFFPRFFNKNDIVYVKNESIKEIYFIKEGTVDVIHRKNGVNNVIKTAEKKDVIGIYFCLCDIAVNYDYIASSDCEMIGISKEKFCGTLNNYPELKEKIKSMANKKNEQYRSINRIVQGQQERFFGRTINPKNSNTNINLNNFYISDLENQFKTNRSHIIKLDDKGLNVMKYIHLSHLDLEQEIIKRRQTNI